MNQYNRRKAAESEEPEESKDGIAGLCVREWKEEVIMEERLYDLVFIVRPATPERRLRGAHGHRHTCAEKGGKIEKTENWGETRKLGLSRGQTPRRDLHHQEIHTTHGELIAELERRLRVQDNVIKYQTVRLDEDLKRQKKLTLKREKRARGVRAGRRLLQRRCTGARTSSATS